MAGGNCREYLKGEEVKLKKYFYVLRPLLACEWILKNNTPPPMLFNDLLFLLPQKLKVAVDKLLDIKMNQPEISLGKKIMELNDWIESELKTLETKIKELPADTKPDWKELDTLFLKEIEAK